MVNEGSIPSHLVGKTSYLPWVWLKNPDVANRWGKAE